MDKTRSEKLLEYIKEFQFKDLIGIGNLLGAEEKDDFQEYVTEILVKYNDQNRKYRKEILKLAQQIVLANRDLAAGGKLE